MTGWTCTVCGANAPQGKYRDQRCPAKRPALRIPVFGYQADALLGAKDPIHALLVLHKWGCRLRR